VTWRIKSSSGVRVDRPAFTFAALTGVDKGRTRVAMRRRPCSTRCES
jgi:hypothetical protein